MRYALIFNTTGLKNTAGGYRMLFYNKIGSFNTAIGFTAGLDNGSTNLSNTGSFGYEAIVYERNTVRKGNSSITSIGAAPVGRTFQMDHLKPTCKKMCPD